MNGDRVVIEHTKHYKSHTGVIFQSWERYFHDDTYPRYNIQLDDPQDGSTMRYENEIRLDVLGEMAK